jgi:hypothetical protein|nr:MAG TPA: hypothetical protein [Caudoviricetes sp.]
MYSVKGENTLFVTRGDSASFRLDLIDADGSPFILQQDDKLTFTVKKTTSDKEALISKTVTNAIVLTPSDTNDLPYGKYVYDLQLNRANGYVETIITPSTLIIGEEVTF